MKKSESENSENEKIWEWKSENEKIWEWENLRPTINWYYRLRANNLGVYKTRNPPGTPLGTPPESPRSPGTLPVIPHNTPVIPRNPTKIPRNHLGTQNGCT